MKMFLSSEKQKKLVLENLRLVYFLAKKIGSPQGDYEDIVSIGTIGLIKAAATFDESKEIKFASYAARCINNEIFMHLRKEKVHKNDRSLEETICSDRSGKELTLKDLISVEEDFTKDVTIQNEFTNVMDIILNALSLREKKTILYRMANVNQKIIAQKINVSQSYVSRLERNVIRKVKVYYKTSKQYRKIYVTEKAGNAYKISFTSKDIKQLKKQISVVLKNTTLSNDLADFKITCTDSRVSILISVQPESINLLAEIIEILDNYA